MNTYKIVRMYRDNNINNRIIKEGLTLEEAQKHCNRDDTHEAGIWFDGYESE